MRYSYADSSSWYVVVVQYPVNVGDGVTGRVVYSICVVSVVTGAVVTGARGVGVADGVTGTVVHIICAVGVVTGVVVTGARGVGVGDGVTGTVLCTSCNRGVATDPVLMEAELMHPLSKTPPVTRITKMQSALLMFIVRTSDMWIGVLCC